MDETPENLYQKSRRGELDIDENADQIIAQLDSGDTQRARTAGKALVVVASESPSQLIPYTNELVSKLTSGNATEKTAEAISCIAPALPEQTFDSHREPLVKFLETDSSERADGWILEALIPDIQNQDDSIETIVPRAVELLEPAGIEVAGNTIDPVSAQTTDEIPNTLVTMSSVRYLTEVARRYPETLSEHTDQLLNLRNHPDPYVRQPSFQLLARLSDHDSPPVSGEEFAADLSAELTNHPPAEVISLIEAAEITIAATPDCWCELNDSLYPLLAADADNVRRQACKSLLSIVGQHPSLPSNPGHLHDRLSELAAEFQLVDVYGQQVEWALDRLRSCRND